MENMIKMIIKALGLKPEQVQDQINGASKMLGDFQAQLDRIEFSQKKMHEQIEQHLLGGE